MWAKRVMVALLAAPVLLLGPVPTAHAAPDPSLTVTEVTVDRTSVAVSGLNTVPILVRVKGVYDSTEPGDQDRTVYVVLERTSGTGPLRWMVSTNLALQPGTTIQNAVWSGTLNVPSTATGTFKVTGVMPRTFGVFSGDMTEPTPFDGPTVTVAGYHLPKVTASVSPKVVPFGSPYSIRWAVTDSATGKPYGTRLTVLLGVDAECAEVGGLLLRTDVNGIVTRSYKAADAEWVNCLRIPGKPFDISGLGLVVARPGIVSAVPSKASAPVGTLVPVNGSVLGPPYRCPVILQRLYGATQWRGVSSGNVRQSGRFTVTAQPAYRGLIPYRVYFPTCNRYQAGLSKVFYIRGT
ncbi:hypothetical protein ACIBL3_03455 [Kribbella sp. NPDC050124]|uniref:hypothetical protein n=1 Tax=Kribbella sp. NPDC050124 TaxID=3364114 RepID=UPI0037ACA093